MMNIMRQKYNDFRKNKYPTYPFTLNGEKIITEDGF